MNTDHNARAVWESLHGCSSHLVVQLETNRKELYTELYLRGTGRCSEFVNGARAVWAFLHGCCPHTVVQLKTIRKELYTELYLWGTGRCSESVNGCNLTRQPETIRNELDMGFDSDMGTQCCQDYEESNHKEL